VRISGHPAELAAAFAAAAVVLRLALARLFGRRRPPGAP